MAIAFAIHTGETPDYRSIDSRRGLCAARLEALVISAPRRNTQLAIQAVGRSTEVEI